MLYSSNNCVGNFFELLRWLVFISTCGLFWVISVDLELNLSIDFFFENVFHQMVNSGVVFPFFVQG